MPVQAGKDQPKAAALIQHAEAKWPVKGYGWRASGSVPGSLHPKGEAVDIPCGKRLGDEIAEYYRSQAAAHGVTVVIWWRRIASEARGWEWRAYNGPSPHTDHVHVSVPETGGTGGPAQWVDEKLNPFSETIGLAGSALEMLADPQVWGRIGKVSMGVLMTLIGTAWVARNS